MRWNVSEYNNVKDIRVPPNNLWKPDILMYNRYTFLNLILLAWYRVGGIMSWCLDDVNTRPVYYSVPVKLSTQPTRPTWWWPAMVPAPTSHQVREELIWQWRSKPLLSSGIFMSSCPMDITWFPFDDQDCEMKFGSWTYNGFKVHQMSSLAFTGGCWIWSF